MVVEKFQGYLLEKEIKRYNNSKRLAEESKENEAAAIVFNEQHKNHPTTIGNARYNQMGQVGGRRVINRPPTISNEPKFTSTAQPMISTYGVREPFQRRGLVTNPVYTKTPNEERKSLEQATRNALGNKDVSFRGVDNIPQSQFEINMQNRKRYSQGNSQKFDRAQGALLAKQLGQSAFKTRQVVAKGLATKSYPSEKMHAPLVNEDTGTKSKIDKIRGTLVNSSAPRNYEFSAMGASRSVHRPLTMTRTRIEPIATITKKNDRPNFGNRTVIKREKFATEGKGALDVMENVSQVDRLIPGMSHVTRATSMYGKPMGGSGTMTNFLRTVASMPQEKIVTRPYKNSARDGLLLSSFPERPTDSSSTSVATTHRYQKVMPKGKVTLKREHVFSVPVPLPRMVQNIMRY